MPWLTGNPPADNDFICRRVRIPNEQTLRASVTGALLDLALEENWEQFGTLDPDVAAQLFMTMLIDFLEDDMCGIGEIKMYGRDSLPVNVLACDGTTYNRADYPRLYDLIHPTLRNDLAETFTTPDLRDRFVLASGVTYPDFAETGGEIDHTLSIDTMPPHDHVTDPHSHTSAPHTHGYTQPTFGIDIESVGVPDPTGVGNPPVPMSTTASSAIIDNAVVTVQQTGNGNPHNNMPPYYVAIFGIVAS